MKEQIRILIGYDGSPCADAALDDLSRAGLPRNAEATILTVREVWLSPPTGNVIGSIEHSLTAAGVPNSKSRRVQTATAVVPTSEPYSLALRAKARLETQFPAWTIKVEETSGSPARQILQRAEELKPNLISVGCQGRSALGRFLIGSVSQKVVNEARCTVRVSRGTAWKHGSPVRIVVGLDGTAGSELALSAVASRVWPASSSVRLIAVVDSNQGDIAAVPLLNKNPPVSPNKKRTAWVDKFMKIAAEKLRPTQLSISTRIEEGDPKRVLIADAEEWGADCIFVGSSGANGLLERFLLGSVATAVVARAHCSVEVVRGGYERSA